MDAVGRGVQDLGIEFPADFRQHPQQRHIKQGRVSCRVIHIAIAAADKRQTKNQCGGQQETGKSSRGGNLLAAGRRTEKARPRPC